MRGGIDLQPFLDEKELQRKELVSSKLVMETKAHLLSADKSLSQSQSISSSWKYHKGINHKTSALRLYLILRTKLSTGLISFCFSGASNKRCSLPHGFTGTPYFQVPNLLHLLFVLFSVIRGRVVLKRPFRLCAILDTVI